MKKHINIFIICCVFFLASCLSTHDRMFTSTGEIEQKKILGTVKVQYWIYSDIETFESIKGLIYRGLLAEAKSKYLNVDVGNITIEGNFSWFNILAFPVNHYISPFIMRIRGKGFVKIIE